MEVASEFIAMASHLMYIKTRMLLSEAEKAEAESEMEELIASLRQRQRKDAYEQIKNRLRRARASKRHRTRHVSQTARASAPGPDVPLSARPARSARPRLLQMQDRVAAKRRPPPPMSSFAGKRRRRAVSGGPEGCRRCCGGSLVHRGMTRFLCACSKGSAQPVREWWRPF